MSLEFFLPGDCFLGNGIMLEYGMEVCQSIGVSLRDEFVDNDNIQTYLLRGKTSKKVFLLAPPL